MRLFHTGKSSPKSWHFLLSYFVSFDFASIAIEKMKEKKRKKDKKKKRKEKEKIRKKKKGKKKKGEKKKKKVCHNISFREAGETHSLVTVSFVMDFSFVSYI